MVTSWLLAMAQGNKIALYCSDVSGAFDRVDSFRLRNKLLALGMHFRLVRVIESWLRSRTARVVVSGAQSESIDMSDMVYQGTVWGPSLWNTFYSDAALAIRMAGFIEAWEGFA